MLETQADFARAEPPGAPRDLDRSSPVVDSELGRAHRVARDRLQPEDIRWLCKGFSAFLASGGRLSLERCLRLPANERALQRAQRDHWLRSAWQLLDPGLSAWRRSELLAEEVRRFQATKWPRWSQLGHPSPGARAVDEALFQAFSAHSRVPTTAMQLHNIASDRRRA